MNHIFFANSMLGMARASCLESRKSSFLVVYIFDDKLVSNRCPPFHFMLGHSALCAIRLLHCCPLCHSAIAHVCADRVGIPHGSRVGYKDFVSDVIIYSSYFHTNMVFFFCLGANKFDDTCCSPSRPECGLEKSTYSPREPQDLTVCCRVSPRVQEAFSRGVFCFCLYVPVSGCCSRCQMDMDDM